MSEVKSSVVTNVQANGTWENSYGTFYSFEVEFENGDVGEYSSKSQDQTKFVKGQEAFYSVKHLERGNKIKPEMNPNGQSSGQRKSSGGGSFDDYWKKKYDLDVKRLEMDFDKQRCIIAQSSYAQAVQMYQGGGITIEEIRDQADVIYDYVLSKSKLPL